MTARPRAATDLAAHLRRDPGLQLRQGQVAAVNDDGTANITLSGSSVVIPSVTLLGPAVAGDTVWLLAQRGDLLALGTPVGAWQTPSAFTNGWTEYDVALYPVRFRRHGDEVRLAGLLAPGTSGTSAFTLPAGYRPTRMVHTVGLNSAGPGNAHAIRVLTTGQVRLDGNATHTWWAIDNVTVPLT